MSERLHELQQWLQMEFNLSTNHLVPLTNDASFRRYFRITINGTSQVIMDAPPNKENCLPFIEVARRLRQSGLNAPEVIMANLERGFLLLTDFGSQLYLPALNETQADQLYRDAITALVTMQKLTSAEGLPPYDHRLLHQEMNLFTDWLLGKHLHFQLAEPEQQKLVTNFEQLSANALSQPQVFVHRDYHSRNLMVVSPNNPGILDFQDAVKGAITYDLVSLLRDCYIAWPLEQVHDWAMQYFTQAQQQGLLSGIPAPQFLRWFDWMGIQRHLKASGIFARLYHRDGKSNYLKDIPRTLNYIVTVASHYSELAYLHELVSQRVLPAYLEKMPMGN
jgi:hypothetical protein